MHKVRRAFVWLHRISHCRGFGVQSPWAYRLIRYVLNEHYPYYAYDELLLKIPNLDVITRRLCELYFRIANYRQADVFIDFAAQTEAYDTYVKAGCHRTQVVRVSICENNNVQYSTLPKPVELVRMSLKGDYSTFFESLLPLTDQNSIIVMEDINKGRKEKKFWQQVMNDPRTGVVFDLYYCGIIFFDHSRYKQNYIVNF